MDPYVQVVNTSMLGEGPHWDATANALLYVDIQGRTVHRLDPVTSEHTKVNVEVDNVGLVVPVEGQANQYVVATGRDFQLMEWDGHSTTPSSLEVLLSVEPDHPGNRINDGKCDTSGRLWAGTIAAADDPDSANLYKIVTGNITTEVTGVNISNGIAWNSDNTLMYYNDTPTRRVDVFDYDNEQGTISNRRTVFDMGSEVGDPDGMTIDANGHLYVGCWGGYQLLQIDPTTGTKVRSIQMPTANITSAAFGGSNLDVLYVTSAMAGLSEIDLQGQPDAGCLFQITNVGRGQSAGNPYRMA